MSTNKRIIFQRILCPIDLTPESDESLRYGIALAKAYGAELLVINCTDSGAVSDSRERDQIKGFLDTAVRKHLRLPASADFGWRSVVIHGDPKTAISQEAAERRADLIVMRSRRRPYAAALLGSTAESVCRTAPCPVMITHPREQDWAGATTNDVGLQRVLVAYDFSTDSELALSYGLSLAQEYQAEIHLLHVLPSVTPQVAFAGVLAETGFGGGLSSFHASSRLKDALPPEISLWCETKLAVREGPPYGRNVGSARQLHFGARVCGRGTSSVDCQQGRRPSGKKTGPRSSCNL